MVDYKYVFENAIVTLCASIGKDGVKKLDSILTQNKSDAEIIGNIIINFPHFNEIFSKEFTKENYACTI